MTTTPTSTSERAVHARHGYSSYQIAIHWSVVGLVAANWLLGQGMEGVFDAREEGETVINLGPAYMHIAIGIVIFLTMIARLTARVRRPVETAAGSKHRLLALLGRINHWAFYVVLLILPLLGALAWFGGSEAAGGLHGLLAWLLVILIALHVGGAVLHLILGENIFRRMFRSSPGT